MGTENTATVKAETAKPGSGAPQGSGADGRSLTLQNAQEGKSAFEIAVAAEEAFAKQGAGDTQVTTETETETAETQETTAEGETTESTTETAETTPEGEKANTAEEGDDDVTFDSKGRAFVRKTRLEKLLDKSNKYDQIIEKLADKVIDPETGKTTEKGKEEVSVTTQIQDRIKQAEAALEDSYKAIEKAKADFNTPEEITATRARDKALRALDKAERDLESEEKSQKEAQKSTLTEFHNEVRNAEKQFLTVRDELWTEDAERLAKVDADLDLNDVDHPFRKDIDTVIKQWQREGNPILLKASAFRRAVELVADMHDINLPAVTPKTKPVVKTAPSVKSNTVVTRKNATVIANNSQGGKARMTDEQIHQKLQIMPPDKRMEFLAQIMESQQKAK